MKICLPTDSAFFKLEGELLRCMDWSSRLRRCLERGGSDEASGEGNDKVRAVPSVAGILSFTTKERLGLGCGGRVKEERLTGKRTLG